MVHDWATVATYGKKFNFKKLARNKIHCGTLKRWKATEARNKEMHSLSFPL